MSSSPPRGACWTHRLLALLAGSLLPLAFAPISFYPLAIVMPALMFSLWAQHSPKESAWLGFFFGLGLFGVGVSWVYVAIHDFGFTPVPAAVLLTILFVSFLALVPAIQGYVGARLLQGQTVAVRWLVVLPAVWALFEWLRGWVLTGFPWLNLGYSQIDSPLGGFAPVLGVYGVSWLAALSAGMLVMLWYSNGRVRIHLLLAMAGLWGSAGLLNFVSWTEPTSHPLRVNIVQGNVPQLTKWDPDKMQANLDAYRELTLKHLDADLIIWPENSVTVFYSDLEKSFFDPLFRLVHAKGAELIVGAPVMGANPEQYYSSMVSLGATPGVFNKKHLVPFGEFMPMQSLLRGLVAFFDLPMSGFSAGAENQPLLHAAGQPLATSICYEDAFGEELITQLPEATLLLNGSNNAWYGDSLAPHQHLQISRMRARETGRMLMRATTNGISAIVDQDGRILQRSPQFEASVLKGIVQPRRGSTPYVMWGNWPVLVIVFGLLAYAVWRVRRFKIS